MIYRLRKKQQKLREGGNHPSSPPPPLYVRGLIASKKYLTELVALSFSFSYFRVNTLTVNLQL